MRMILWLFVLWGLMVAGPQAGGDGTVRSGEIPVADGNTGVPPN